MRKSAIVDGDRLGEARRALLLVLSVVAVLSLTLSPAFGETKSEGLEFFERNIRPVLADRCFKCHSAQSEKLKGGLHLDSREGMLKGGHTRPAVVPGDPEKSLLVEAIRYANIDLQMPPKGKLSEREIEAFATWIKLGAPWPDAPKAAHSSTSSTFDLDKRRQKHWAWRPITSQRPPTVQNEGWIRSAVDRFVLSKIEQSKLHPAHPADKAVLIRRLYFDLIGLPPSPDELKAYLDNSSSDAYEKTVDRLLSAPQFGERWARHWLDLVRYAETLGHEFDYAVHNAWRYRDYVIRALNEDVPYDQFVTEHVAGDLLAKPRRHPTDGFNESLIGTSFFWLGQREHSPVDVRQHQAELIDNQIDVMTKTFLGLTVACARCHDHKFDAISTRDFYSLYGVLSSSRYAQRAIDPPENLQPKIERLQRLKTELRQALDAGWSSQAMEFSRYLRGAALADSKHADGTAGPSAPAGADRSLRDVAAELGLEPKRLELWMKVLGEPAITNAVHPFSVWARLSRRHKQSSAQFADAWKAVVREWRDETPRNKLALRAGENVFIDFVRTNYQGWFIDGEAFGSGPSRAGELIVGDTNTPISLVAEPAAHSGAPSRRLQGALRSPTFELRQPYIHLLAAGRECRINLFIDNFTMIRNPIYGGLKKYLNTDAPQWITIDVSMWQGHRAYLEFSDITTPDPADDGKKPGFGIEGYIAVSRILFSDQKSPPASVPSPAAARLLGADDVDSLQTLADRYQAAVMKAIDSWRTNAAAESVESKAQIGLLVWLLQRGLLESKFQESADPSFLGVSKLWEEFRTVESSIREPMRVPAMADGSGLDEHVFVRGSPKNRGEAAPRRFLTALAGADQPAFKQGSGRLELAERMTDRSNPLLARVMVNRVWHHLFGRGIVPTPDDFGVLGQPPSHPELLDWLADWYRTEGRWSTKKLIRLLVTSNTYRMSSQSADIESERNDLNNVWLHRMPVRRMEGEVIRDAILAVSGRLDKTMYGPPVPAHLTEFMEGRGRPGTSGPIDGRGRRSIYLEVRRNFLSPLMRTFDAPVPFTTVGKRTVSNVPAQSLILMNDPFVIEQARVWAQRVLPQKVTSVEERIKNMYEAALSRSPLAMELTEAKAFLQAQGEHYSAASPDALQDERVWTDLAHVLLNVKEFVFVN